MPTVRPPDLDVTLRVGCELVYEATGTATLLLNLRPHRGYHSVVVEELMSLGPALPAQEFVDPHGNLVQRLLLRPGRNSVRHDAIVRVASAPDDSPVGEAGAQSPASLPADLLRYTLPSRYCDSDKLADFAWSQFGHVEHGWPRVQAISAWIHQNIRYVYMSGNPQLSAWDVLQRGYGVCRDFAHLAVALSRTFNVPARYVTGHLPDIGFPDPVGHMDFHAFAEVFLGGRWYTTDARFHAPRIGRVRVASGLDAVDGAFSTIYGAATLANFQVWAYQVPREGVHVGDPIDLSRRLDNSWVVTTDAQG